MTTESQHTLEEREKIVQVVQIMKEASCKLQALGSCPPYIMLAPCLEEDGEFFFAGNGLKDECNLMFLARCFRVKLVAGLDAIYERVRQEQRSN